jgi:hypothetical protein
MISNHNHESPQEDSKCDARAFFNLRLSYIPSVTALFFLLSLCNSSIAGYLPVIGPSPIRVEPHHTHTAAILPPLDMGDGPKTNSVVETVKDVPVAPIKVASHSAAPVEVTQTVQPDPTVSPQILIPYFETNAGGTNRQTVIVAPVPFTPPRGEIPASSTATYSKP